MKEPPLVSALCVTCNRAHFLPRAVENFRSQTYSNKELVVLYHRRDTATKQFLLSLKDSRIRLVELDLDPIPVFGTLRNISLRYALGEYIAIWDDDDWSHPDRLSIQIGALEQSCKSTCIVSRVRIFDQATGNLFLSVRRRWEASLVARRKDMPKYPDIQNGEDCRLVDGLWVSRKLLIVENSELYYWVYHGSQNSGDTAAIHMRTATSLASELVPEALRRPVGAAGEKVPYPQYPDRGYSRWDKFKVLVKNIF